jgi:hypothetical protein
MVTPSQKLKMIQRILDDEPVIFMVKLNLTKRTISPISGKLHLFGCELHSDTTNNPDEAGIEEMLLEK